MGYRLSIGRAEGRRWALEKKGLAAVSRAVTEFDVFLPFLEEGDGMGWLEGQVAIVTGGGSGIGRAVAARFVSEGSKVVVLDRDPKRLDVLARELGTACLTVVGDAADSTAIARCVTIAMDRFGRLDTAVGNVGVFDWHKKLERMEADELEEGFHEIFRINVLSHMVLARECHAQLKQACGSMILTCSTASFRGGGGGALYTASKFSVRGLVHQLAHEWAPDVRVNGVAPGGTLTALAGLQALGSAEREVAGEPRILDAIAQATPLGFVAEPEDHCGIYVLLASRANSRGMTGSVVISDGGLLAGL